MTSDGEAPNRQTGLSVRGKSVTVRKGGTTILDGVDFSAEPGQLVGILGPSGSGKTTLLFALAGFRPIDEGVVTLGGNDVSRDLDQIRERIGFVPQDDIVPTALRVERVLHYAALLRLPELSQPERDRRIEEVLRGLELADRRRLRVSRLSGGQRKRVSIAVELLAEPDVLFADEPSSGLDPALEASLTERLEEMADRGKTVVLTTHILSSIKRFDRLAVIAAGHLAYFGPPEEIREFFDVEDLGDIYGRLGGDGAVGWARRFRTSDVRRRYLRS